MKRTRKMIDDDDDNDVVVDVLNIFENIKIYTHYLTLSSLFK